MKKINLLILLFFVVNVISSQTPCVNGSAGGYPCNNMDLQSRIPATVLGYGSDVRGSDIWGWTDPQNGKEYAIVGTSNSTAFVDVTDPVNPIFLGRLNTSAGTSVWRDIKVYNNYAFIVADYAGAHGMQVFDLTKLRNVNNPPQTFSSDAIYDTDNLGSCHNIVINESKSVAYLVGCKTSNNQGLANGGPIFVDISNPTNPVKMNQYSSSGYCHDAQVVTYHGPDTQYRGKQIFIGSNENKINFLDVTNKNNVDFITNLTYSQYDYTHQGWLTDDHKYFILGDEGDEQGYGFNTRTLIFDVQDLDNPFLSSTHYGSTSASDHNGYVKGNEFYLANYKAGFRLFDLSNVSSGNNSNSMTEIGYFDTYPSSNASSFGGAWSIYPYFSSGNILISDISSGLFVVSRSGTLAVENQSKEENRVTISPNPAEDHSTVVLNNNGQINSIEIINLLGKNIYTKQNIRSNTFSLPIKRLASGMYLVKINKSIAKKLIVK